MTWQNRVRPTITLISPTEKHFTGKWIGSPRTKENKVALFSFPGVVGIEGQDNRMDGDRYSMSVYFDGNDHDLVARRFWEAADERGQWTVHHPMHGLLKLQLLSIAENDEPVREGGYTKFDLTWVELMDAIKIRKRSQANIEELAKQINGKAIEQAEQGFDFSTENARRAIEKTVGKITGAVNEILGPIARVNSEIALLFDSTLRGIQDTMDALVLSPIVLGAQIQDTIQMPALALQDTAARLSGYVELAERILGIPLTGNSVEDKNIALSKELALSAVIGAYGTVAETGTADLLSRNQAIEFAQKLSRLLLDITNALDEDMLAFEGLGIDLQYFSQSSSYADAVHLTAAAIETFLVAAFDLKVEKRFKLDRPRCPVEITVTEYGTLGENDENLDMFLATNELAGNDIILIPSRTEVVIYV